LTSKRYPGVEVSCTYFYEAEQVNYSFHGEFNGGTPACLEIDLIDVKVGNISVYSLLSDSALTALKEEIADAIHEGW
jgi:hypothetical protein